MDNIFDDTGEGNESTQTAEAVVEESTPAQIDSTEGAAPETSTEETQGEQGQEAPATPVDEAKPPTEDEIAELEKEVETALADEKTPKWFKNAVENVYKPKLATLTDQLGSYEPLTQYGTVDEVAKNLELLNGLGVQVSDPATGMPRLTTEPFVKGLYDKNPKVAYQLINDLATLPSPHTQGRSVLEEIIAGAGIDPARIDDYKQFAANGYQLQQGQYPAPDADDLAQIPKELQPTFTSLSPDRRESLMLEDEAIRNETLEDARLAQEAKRNDAERTKTEAAKAAEAEDQRQANFKAAVDQKGTEHFTKSSETVFTSFVDSLAKQAKMSPMESQMIAQTVINSFEPTFAGKQAVEMLKAEGITIDPAIPATIAQMEENARFIAYYETSGDTVNMGKAIAKQVELQERLTAKGNKIIGALAQKKAQSTAATIQTQNSKLAETQSLRHATAGVGSQIGASNGKVDDNFDDEDYLALLRNDPRFGRQ